jgi:CheY-like chemotaxis protein
LQAREHLLWYPSGNAYPLMAPAHMPENFDLLDGLDFSIPGSETGSSAPSPASALQPAVKSSAPASADPRSSPAVQEFFGPYQILSEVGEGGVAKVVRARHIHPHYADKTFALKFLHEALSLDPQVVGLFRREGYLLSMLTHPNIVQTFEAGAQDDRLFIAMEYIAGRDLENLLHRCHQLKMTLWQPLCLHIIRELLTALMYAHELCNDEGESLQLIHRDVNPANVFISFDGTVKLGDFGVASITAGRTQRSREIAGKVGYFAPEQLSGAAVDHRSDLFAVGVALYELLTDVRLFEAADVEESMRLNRRAKIPNPKTFNSLLSRPLEQLLLKALERRPQARFASARQMLVALDAVSEVAYPAAVMRQALGAAMRTAFAKEYAQEQQFQRGLAGTVGATGPLRVAVCMAQLPMRNAMVQLLQQRGHSAYCAENPAALVAHLSAGAAVDVLVLHGRAQEAAWLQLGAHLQRLDPGLRPTVLLVCDALDAPGVERAQALQADEILLAPLSGERFLAALRQRPAVSKAPGAQPLQRPNKVSQRLLLVSGDEAVVRHIRRALIEEPYTLEVVADGPAALARLLTRSISAVLVDAHPPGQHIAQGVQALRDSPGVGMVPAVLLLDELLPPGSLGRTQALPRCQIIGRAAAPAAFVAALQHLQKDLSSGRTFVRYRTQIAAELRYGGRVFSGTVVDLSRGGIMLQCQHLPPRGTPVGVTLRLPVPHAQVELTGYVVRVELLPVPAHSAAAETALVGIELQSFVGNGEASLISYIRSLEASGVHVTPVVWEAAGPSRH